MMGMHRIGRYMFGFICVVALVACGTSTSTHPVAQRPIVVASLDASDEKGFHDQVLVLDGKTGQALWNRLDAGSEVIPQISGSLIYVKNETSTFAALDALTGAMRWSYAGSLSALSSKLAFVYDGKDDILALHNTDGKQLWEIPVTQGTRRSIFVANDVPYIITASDANETIAAIDDNTGAKKWQTTES